MPVKRRSTKRRSPKAMRRASTKRVKSTRARRASAKRVRATPKRRVGVAVSPARRRQISKLISRLSPETKERLRMLSKQYSSM